MVQWLRRLLRVCLPDRRFFQQLFQFNAQRLDRIRQAYEEHGLHRVSQQLNDLPGIGLDEDSLFADEQVVFAISGDEVGETHVQLAAQQAKNAANLCKRDAPLAQLFDNQDVSEIGCGVDTVAPLARWNNDAALVPPLELSGGDTGRSRTSRVLKQSFSILRRIPLSNISVLKCLTPFLLEWHCLSIPITRKKSSVAITCWIRGRMVHGRLDGVRHALDIPRRKIGMYWKAENTSRGVLCVGGELPLPASAWAAPV